MTLLEKLEAAKAALVDIKAGVEAGEKSADDLQNAINDVKDVQTQINAANVAEDLLRGLKAPVEEKADKEEEKVMAYKTIGEQVAAKVTEANINTKSKFNFNVSGMKVAAPMTTPASIAPAITDVDTNIVQQLRRELTVGDLFSAEVISGSALTYFVESSTVEGGAAYTTEGSEKPMMSFGSPTAVTASLRKIASYMKESDELIEDAPWLASAINDRGMYQHQLAVENYLVSALSGTSGIGTGSLLTPDGIFDAIMTVHKNSGYAADAILINPTDYANLRVRKDDNGQYLAGGFAFGPYGQGNVDLYPPIWGVRTVVTTAVAVGTCIVGAFKAGGSVVHKASGVTVDIANQNEDDFIKNMITILIEERLVLAVRRPACFVKISGSSTSTAA